MSLFRIKIKTLKYYIIRHVTSLRIYEKDWDKEHVFREACITRGMIESYYILTEDHFAFDREWDYIQDIINNY